MNSIVVCLFFVLQFCSAGSIALKFPSHHLQRHSSFLRQSYSVANDKSKHFMIKEVPGDGGCLFHAIGAWLTFMQVGKHTHFDMASRELSENLRALSVDTLLSNSTLFVENEQTEYSCNLLAKVAEHYNLTVDSYCSGMLHPQSWGGGPEIVALSNHFQCPIHVYQLTHKARSGLFWRRKRSSSKEFCLQLGAKFGSPQFDAKVPICLLCADGRFPDIAPGMENPVGDHFMALFPSTSTHLLPLDQRLCDTAKCPLYSKQSTTTSIAFRGLLQRSLHRVRELQRRHPASQEPMDFS